MPDISKEGIRIIYLGLLGFIMVSCGGNEYETRVDSKNGFQIDYPVGWDTTHHDPRMNFMAIEDFEDSTDVFGERFNVSIFPHGGIELSAIVDQNIEMAQQFYGNLQIDRVEGKNENGIVYTQLKMPYEAEGISLLNKAVFIVNDTDLFTITTICEAGNEEEYAVPFDWIINSFNWVK